MSIYGTLLAFDDTEEDAPIFYQGSHVLPDETDPRGGSFEFAEIGGWITRDGRDNGSNENKPWPYLRFSAGIGHDSIVLTRSQAAQIHEILGDWLDRTA